MHIVPVRGPALERALRTQLSLYVPPPLASQLEAVRRVVDPIQAALIPAHVTLARDDELEGLDRGAVRNRLRTGAPGALTLQFGTVVRSHEHGLLLPCVAGAERFHALRELVLGGGPVREEIPHLTLAHPRNPRAAGNDVAAAHCLPQPLAIRFATVHWIEQAPGHTWVVRESFVLAGAEPRGLVDTVRGSNDDGADT